MVQTWCRCMDEATFERLVEYVRHYFVDHPPSPVGDAGSTTPLFQMSP